MKKQIKIAMASVLMLTVSGNTMAHDAWVNPAKGPIYNIFYGHKVPEDYNVNKITSLHVLDGMQKEIPYSNMASAKGMRIQTKGGTPAMFVLDYDNGLWTTVGKESLNFPYSMMPEGSAGHHPLKYSKTLISWKSWMTTPAGQRIEFVPVGWTALPAAGQEVKLQCLLDGKPLAGQMVENNSNEEGPKTDANGMVTVKVVSGINRFATDYDISQPYNHDASRLSLTAALVFMAP